MARIAGACSSLILQPEAVSFRIAHLLCRAWFPFPTAARLETCHYIDQTLDACYAVGWMRPHGCRKISDQQYCHGNEGDLQNSRTSRPLYDTHEVAWTIAIFIFNSSPHRMIL